MISNKKKTKGKARNWHRTACNDEMLFLLSSLQFVTYHEILNVLTDCDITERQCGVCAPVEWTGTF